MDLFKRRLRKGGSILLPLFFVTPLLAEAPVVDLMAKPKEQSIAYAAKPLSTEQRLQVLERRMNNDALIDLYQRLDALQIELQQLRGFQEEQGHTLEGVKQRQRDLYIDLDQRIVTLQKSVKQLSAPEPVAAISAVPVLLPTVTPELSAGANITAGHEQSAALNGPIDNNITAGDQSITPAAIVPNITTVGPDKAVIGIPSVSGDVVVEGGAVIVSPPEKAVVVPQPINPLQEQSDYQEALDLLMAGSYKEAINAFTSFLESYPQGEYRMNAQYWLGEAYYVSRHFDQAIESFSQVIADKNGRKRPDAMLKSGYSFYEQKRWTESREILQELIVEYPQSAVSGLAEQRLQMLREAKF